MTVVLELKPEIEARVATLAAATLEILQVVDRSSKVISGQQVC